ncbi:MAG: TIGR02300 family protein [Alphaproteobacteria bacterium]
MSNPARGTKRVCPGCGARFYDLGRSPITCPVCQAAYQVSAPASPRRAEKAQAEPAPKPEAEEVDPPSMGGAEVISLDEAEQAEEAAVEDEEIVDLGDEEDISASDGEDNTFLEEDEEGNDDVSDIVRDGAKEDT